MRKALLQEYEGLSPRCFEYTKAPNKDPDASGHVQKKIVIRVFTYELLSAMLRVDMDPPVDDVTLPPLTDSEGDFFEYHVHYIPPRGPYIDCLGSPSIGRKDLCENIYILRGAGQEPVPLHSINPRPYRRFRFLVWDYTARPPMNEEDRAMLEEASITGNFGIFDPPTSIVQALADLTKSEDAGPLGRYNVAIEHTGYTRRADRAIPVYAVIPLAKSNLHAVQVKLFRKHAKELLENRTRKITEERVISTLRERGLLASTASASPPSADPPVDLAEIMGDLFAPQTPTTE